MGGREGWGGREMVGERGKEEGDGGRGGRKEEGGWLRRLIHPHGYKVTCTNVHT